MNFLLVFLGGGLGSICRYALSLMFPVPQPDTFAWATFIANLFACFVLGLGWGYLAKQTDSMFHQNLNWFLLTGFCGGFSTFSTFSKESLVYFEAAAWGYLTTYLTFSLVMGAACIFLGWRLLQ